MSTVDEEQTWRLNECRAVHGEAQSRLRRSGYPELRLIACEFHQRVLTLRGRVSTFYLKQVAQTAVSDLADVGEINNRLEVAAFHQDHPQTRAHARVP